MTKYKSIVHHGGCKLNQEEKRLSVLIGNFVSRNRLNLGLSQDILAENFEEVVQNILHVFANEEDKEK